MTDLATHQRHAPTPHPGRRRRPLGEARPGSGPGSRRARPGEPPKRPHRARLVDTRELRRPGAGRRVLRDRRRLRLSAIPQHPAWTLPAGRHDPRSMRPCGMPLSGRYSTFCAPIGPWRPTPSRDHSAWSQPPHGRPLCDGRHGSLAFTQGPDACLVVHVARFETHSAVDAVLDNWSKLELEPGSTGPRGMILRQPGAVHVRWAA